MREARGGGVTGEESQETSPEEKKRLRFTASQGLSQEVTWRTEKREVVEEEVRVPKFMQTYNYWTFENCGQVG